MVRRRSNRVVVPRVGVVPGVDRLIVRVVPTSPRRIPPSGSSAAPSAAPAGTAGRPSRSPPSVSMEVRTTAAFFEVAFVLLFLSASPAPTVVVAAVQTWRAAFVTRLILVVGVAWAAAGAATRLRVVPLVPGCDFFCFILFAGRCLSVLFLFDPGLPFALKK